MKNNINIIKSSTLTIIFIFGFLISPNLVLGAISDIPDTTWPTTDGEVKVIVKDEANGIVYIAGDFTTVGGQARNRIAAINASDGSVTSWNPDANDVIYALALSSDNATVYVGGSFTSIGGQTRNNIAALNASDGLATAWNPNGNISVLAITLSSNNATVYVGGSFTSIGGQARNYIAALNASDGLATAWNPNADAAIYALTLSSDNATVYAGGEFTSIGGQARNYIAALNASDGLATAWNPNADNMIFAIVLSSNGNTIYTGGWFTSIGGQARNRIAAINTSDGLATAWNPDSDNVILVIALSSDNATVYTGGFFTSIGGQARNRIAAINTSDGLATAWNPDNDGEVRSLVLSTNGNSIYIGGAFLTIGVISQNYFAKFSATVAEVIASALSPAHKNPYPTLYSVSPDSASVNSDAVEIRLKGDDFLGTQLISDSEVFFDGKKLEAKPMGYTGILATIPKEYLTKAGSFEILVKNPGPGGGDSHEVRFTVTEEVKSVEQSAEEAKSEIIIEAEPEEKQAIPEESLPEKLLKQLRGLVNELLNRSADVPGELRLSVNSYKGLFRKNISRGDDDGEVWLLQRFLNDRGFTVAASGPGSFGNETFYFGPATQAALVAFQKANNIEPALGYFGPITRASIESLSE